MKKVVGIILCVLILVPVLTVGGMYLVISHQYKDTFMPGKFINSIYAADMTTQQLNEKLVSATEMPDFVITDRSQKTYTFPLSDIGYIVDYSADLEQIQKSQTVLGFVNWFMDSNANKGQNLTVTPTFSYDEEKLMTYLAELDYLKDSSSMTGKKVKVEYNELKGYYLINDTDSMLNHDAAVSAIKKNLDQQIYETNLTKEKCYVQPTYTPAMKEELALWDDLKLYMKSKITYVFDDKEYVIHAAKTAKLLAKDEDGNLLRDDQNQIYLDEKLLKEFVKEFADEYNTVNKPRDFKTTRGDLVSIPTGTYGSLIDEKAEIDYLATALKFGREETREPEYKQKAFSGLTGLNDIGNTYIEVDMTNQHLYYYLNGRLRLDTDVVTGCTNLGRGTPVKVCYVYMKQKNRTLRGEGYESFVNYWMPVWRGVGIHDSSWRSKYGGKIYKTAGSHGCINTPINMVSQLYDLVEIGTPVLLFY